MYPYAPCPSLSKCFCFLPGILTYSAYGHIAPRSDSIVKDVDTIESAIDCDYSGKIQVTLANTSDLDLKINKNNSIAQLIVERIAVCNVEITQI